MTLRTALERMWDYGYEIAVSISLFSIVLTMCYVIICSPDAFTDWQCVQMGIWSLFAFSAMICMYNTAVSRVAIQKAESREED